MFDMGSTPVIRNSILWGDTSAWGATEILDYNPINAAYSNIDQNGFAGSNGNIRVNPEFIDVSDADPANWNFRLQSISPCIDTGDNSVVPIEVATDFEGSPRIFDGDMNGTDIVDMGADEYYFVDDSAPTGSVSIDAGAIYATSTSVTLTLPADDPSGVSDMCISNTVTCSAWETYAASKSWDLLPGDGTKIVYVWFRDGVGNENVTPCSDSITLDTAGPGGGSFHAAPGDGQVSLDWSGFSDPTSGIASYTLVFGTSGIPASCLAGTQIYSGTAASYLHTGLTNGTPQYYRLCATDNAGNASVGLTASATPQSPPPIAVSPDSKDFLSVNLESTSPGQFTITNGGATELMITSIGLAGGDVAMFEVVVGGSNPCQTLTPTILPGGNCTIIVNFRPTSEGAKTTTLRIISNAPTSPTDIRAGRDRDIAACLRRLS